MYLYTPNFERGYFNMVMLVKATKADAKELLEAKVDAFSWDVITYGFGPPEYDSLESQLRIFDKEKVRYFKILDDTKLVGGICVLVLDDNHYHLGGLYIATEFQNKGIGSQAIEFLFHEFPDAGKWTLDTPYLSFRNHHFYEKLGFKKVGETLPETDGFYLFQYEKNNM
jgi:GNAT superfamily N-acetyltransferase